MNNLQEHIVLSESANAVWFGLHQPIAALERADTACLYSEFMSWVLAFAGYVGWRLQVWGIPPDLFKHVRRQTMCFVGDAIKVNDSVFKYFTQTIKSGPTPEQGKHLALQIRCGIHQVGLTRRNIALGYEGYWSSLVRLGHLFEGFSFRTPFAASMSMLIQSSFEYVEVSKMPEEATSWNAAKIAALQLHLDTHMGLGKGSMSSRMKGLLRLLEVDNGNAESTVFVHYCKGCCPGGRQEACTKMISCYLDVFSHMPVPLLYRWKHGAVCNSYIQDGMFLHKVLVRTLTAMPTMK